MKKIKIQKAEKPSEDEMKSFDLHLLQIESEEYDKRKQELEKDRVLFYTIYPNRKCTCDYCDAQVNGCPYAFDLYNTDGDCLAIK